MRPMNGWMKNRTTSMIPNIIWVVFVIYFVSFELRIRAGRERKLTIVPRVGVTAAPVIAAVPELDDPDPEVEVGPLNPPV